MKVSEAVALWKQKQEQAAPPKEELRDKLVLTHAEFREEIAKPPEEQDECAFLSDFCIVTAVLELALARSGMTRDQLAKRCGCRGWNAMRQWARKDLHSKAERSTQMSFQYWLTACGFAGLSPEVAAVLFAMLCIPPKHVKLRAAIGYAGKRGPIGYRENDTMAQFQRVFDAMGRARSAWGKVISRYKDHRSKS